MITKRRVFLFKKVIKKRRVFLLQQEKLLKKRRLSFKKTRDYKEKSVVFTKREEFLSKRHVIEDESFANSNCLRRLWR